MDNPFRRPDPLPVPAVIAVLALALLAPACLYLGVEVWQWQMGDSAAGHLTARFFWAITLGRGAGAVALAILLLSRRRPAAVAITITALWLAGPPVTFLWIGIVTLAESGAQSSWVEGPLDGIGRAILFPSLVTVLLLGPPSVRRAYGIS